jgi:hypothetical protein
MIRGKFKCTAVTYHGDEAKHETPRTYELSAVYDTDTPENARFAKATPWGELKIRIDNPDARLVSGVEYYLDLTRCDLAQEVDYIGEAKAEETGYVSELPDAATHHPDPAPAPVTGTYAQGAPELMDNA